MESIGFNNELSLQLQEARKENDPIIQPNLVRDSWMLLSEIAPGTTDFDDLDDVLPELRSHRKNYTEQQLNKIKSNWINS